MRLCDVFLVHINHSFDFARKCGCSMMRISFTQQAYQLSNDSYLRVFIRLKRWMIIILCTDEYLVVLINRSELIQTILNLSYP